MRRVRGGLDYATRTSGWNDQVLSRGQRLYRCTARVASCARGVRAGSDDMSPHGRPRFEARLSKRADGVRLALVGALDEHSRLKELPSKIGGSVVYLDLGEVDR